MLTNRVALITGAARGIGRAAALEFAVRGALVVAADVDGAGSAETAALIAESGGRALAQTADVSRATECAALVAAAVEWGGGLHVVVNNAGVGQFAGTVETLEEAEWDRVSRPAIPHLRRAGGGVILNVASPHAFATTEGVAAYAASKGGVVSLSRQMAIDFARDRIRVLSVVPGAVDTPMLRAHAERQETTLDALGFHADPGMMGRIGSPEELARAMAWLASDEASFITGSPIIVDGGILSRL
jgi:NAD(P)-dependent dehydrogenase (short-subunit alcohol dehydrogenase family)